LRKLIISFCLVIPQVIFSQTLKEVHLLPYIAYINFENAFQKEYTGVFGIYGYYGVGLKHSFEAGADFTQINFGTRDLEVSEEVIRFNEFKINQLDLTAVYNNFQLLNLQLRAGIHTIITDDSLTNNAIIVFGGVKRYRSNIYNAGIDIYGSFYNNYAPNLKAVQITATFGFNFGNYYQSGSFYAETRGHYINLSEEAGFGETQFPSIEQSLFYYYKKFTMEAFFWIGYQLFAVQNNGFVVYNLAERHLGAYGGTIKFGLSNKASIKIKISRARFKELGLDEIVKSTSVVLITGFSL